MPPAPKSPLNTHSQSHRGTISTKSTLQPVNHSGLHEKLLRHTLSQHTTDKWRVFPHKKSPPPQQLSLVSSFNSHLSCSLFPSAGTIVQGGATADEPLNKKKIKNKKIIFKNIMQGKKKSVHYVSARNHSICSPATCICVRCHWENTLMWAVGNPPLIHPVISSTLHPISLVDN